MREVDVPDESSPLSRSVAASLASILEIETSDVPLPAADHPEPWTVWRNWLARRRAGLVPIVNPVDFSWPGPWLAVLPAADSDELVGAVAFGAPPGLAWCPLPASDFEQIQQGFFIAPHDVALAHQDIDQPTGAGRVEAILIAPEAEADQQRIERAEAVAGRGLVGDRYHEGRGTFSNPHARGHHLTLIEQDALDHLRTVSPDYRAEDARRNLVTTGIALNDLVGWRFRVGDVECIGERLCEPCAHLDRIAVEGALRPMVHRGGLRANIVTSGTIAIGDPVEPLAPVESD